MVWIKICGLTNLADANKAVALGADALGFIFAPSKRKVAPELVKEIIGKLPAEVEKIGVFADQDMTLVRKIAGYCGLTGLQFHGTEPPGYCTSFADYTVIKVFRVTREIKREEIHPYILNNCLKRILFDTYLPAQLGGTGQTFPWEIVSQDHWQQVPVIIAGGLHPDNVTQAIQQGQPFGIDVSSGVEGEPGKKDWQKLESFIERARGL